MLSRLYCGKARLFVKGVRCPDVHNIDFSIRIHVCIIGVYLWSDMMWVRVLKALLDKLFAFYLTGCSNGSNNVMNRSIISRDEEIFDKVRGNPSGAWFIKSIDRSVGFLVMETNAPRTPQRKTYCSARTMIAVIVLEDTSNRAVLDSYYCF